LRPDLSSSSTFASDFAGLQEGGRYELWTLSAPPRQELGLDRIACRGGGDLAAGILTFVWPDMTALALLMFIAAWAILIGLFQITAAIRLRKEIENEWLLGFSGALSLLFGLLMIASPSAGALTVVWMIATYSILFGVLLIALGFRLKNFVDSGVRTRTIAGTV
jgi:hypothetical protein